MLEGFLDGIDDLGDGAGGQVGFADPEAGIAAGFVRSQFTSRTTYSGRLLELLYACAGRA